MEAPHEPLIVMMLPPRQLVMALALVVAASGVAQAQFPPGDMNCDGTTDGLDVHPFVLSLTDPQAYRDAYPGCNINHADVNNDAAIDLSDIDAFVRLLTIG